MRAPLVELLLCNTLPLTKLHSPKPALRVLVSWKLAATESWKKKLPVEDKTQYRFTSAAQANNRKERVLIGGDRNELRSGQRIPLQKQRKQKKVDHQPFAKMIVSVIPGTAHPY